MSATLKDVLVSFGYQDSKQHVALTKLLVFRGCLNEEYKNKLISTEEANSFASKSFDSLEEGVNWLCDITQKNWLRASFQKEGVGKGQDPIINVVRWTQQDASAIESNQESQLLEMFKDLGLVDTVSFPQQKISHVVVHGAMEDHAAERINFLPDFSGHLYYMSNPRGLFNNERSLAPILASWFNMPQAVPVIQSVLDKNKDLNTSDKHWLKDLQGLKKDILTALDVATWPENKGWYYKNPKPFDIAAQSEGRQLLAGWPTALDMVEYLLQQRALAEPGKFKHIELHAVYSLRPGRVANTEDNIEDWYKNYGQQLPADTQVVFISNNSRRLHYIHFQDVILKTTLQRLEKSPGEMSNRVMTVGQGANEISLSAATDVFAKIFYTKRKQIEALRKKQGIDNSSGFSSNLGMRQFLYSSNNSSSTAGTSTSINPNADQKNDGATSSASVGLSSK